jgi:predicted Zn-dependent protease
MATRSRTSFQKRQKEIARAEKQRDKAAKRAQRKLNPSAEGDEESDVITAEEAAGIEPLLPVAETPSNGNN